MEMEERVDTIYPSPSPPPEPHTSNGDAFYDSPSDEQRPKPLPPPPQHRLYNHNAVYDDSQNTYVVQIPKDQIYWIPPPEHAQIVENCKKPTQKKKSCCGRCLCWTLCAFFVLAVLSGIMLAIYNLTLCPRNPIITVRHFTVWHKGRPRSSLSLSKFSNVTYDIELEVSNPNGGNAITLMSGTASLLYKGHVIAHGKSPVVSQEPMGVDEADVEMIGKSGRHLPKEVIESLKGNKKKQKKMPKHKYLRTGKKVEEEVLETTTIRTTKMSIHDGLALKLKIKLPLMKKTWLKIQNSKTNVVCDMVVKSLATKNARIMSEKCDYT